MSEATCGVMCGEVGRGFRHSASISAFTRVFDALWTRVNALKASSGLRLLSGPAVGLAFPQSRRNTPGAPPRISEAIIPPGRLRAAVPTGPIDGHAKPGRI